MTAPERRNLALHGAVADKFCRNPMQVRASALRNLKTMRTADTEGHASNALDGWERLLEADDEALGGALVDGSARSRSLHQSSPFAGVLSDDEIREVLNAEWQRARS